MTRRLIPLLPLLVLLSSSVRAQPESPHWVSVTTVADTSYFVDSASVTATRGGSVEAWIRLAFPQTILSRTGYRYDGEVTRVRIDCRRSAWTGIRSISYNGVTPVRTTSSKPRPISSPPRPQDRAMLLEACRIASSSRP